MRAERKAWGEGREGKGSDTGEGKAIGMECGQGNAGQGMAEQSRAEQVRAGQRMAGHDMAGQGTPVGETGYRAKQAYCTGSVTLQGSVKRGGRHGRAKRKFLCHP